MEKTAASAMLCAAVTCMLAFSRLISGLIFVGCCLSGKWKTRKTLVDK